MDGCARNREGEPGGGGSAGPPGWALQTLGSATGEPTVVPFGQDYLVKDQIEREEREVADIVKAVAELDAEMKRTSGGRSPAPHWTATALSQARAQKVHALRPIEPRKKRLITLQDTLDLHCPSEIVVRGTLFPGGGDRKPRPTLQTRTAKNMITLYFDQVHGNRGKDVTA